MVWINETILHKNMNIVIAISIDNKINCQNINAGKNKNKTKINLRCYLN